MNNVIGGVDTHKAVHCAAVVDLQGRLINVEEFPASRAGYGELLEWMRRHGELEKVGIEGTGAYGAGLARYLHDEGVEVLEVPRPDRRLRRSRGKSDPIDAESAARAALSGAAVVAPKIADGPIEAIRALRVARGGAMKARTAGLNALRSMIVTAPEVLRHDLRGITSGVRLIEFCSQLEPDSDDLADPVEATKYALKSLAERVRTLTDEMRRLDRQLAPLVAATAPATLETFAMGTDTTGALLVTIGDNPDRLRSEAAFARLCGVAPIPASSGKTQRHRLHRGGDRTANRALHIAVVVRMRYCEKTKAYVARRTSEGLSKPEIIRCLKRHLAREIFRALRSDYSGLAAT